MYILDAETVLTDDQAAYIKLLRNGPLCHSWRLLARKFTRKYPDFVEKHNLIEMADRDDQLKDYSNYMTAEEKTEMTAWENGNQLLGMDLCSLAMHFYKESMDDGW